MKLFDSEWKVMEVLWQENDRTAKEISPVSYTHLDVYKRQMLARGSPDSVSISLIVICIPPALSVQYQAGLQSSFF